MPKKPDNRELSLQTGFLFPIYLDLIRLIKNLNECREHLEKTEPWYDKPRHPRSWYDASKPYANGTTTAKPKCGKEKNIT